jgi:superfamily II DNA helicase RecQ
MASAFSEELWNRAFSAVKKQFKIDELFTEQVEGIKSFFEGTKNVFVSLPTGFGKSLIYQSFPIVADCLYERPRGTSTLLVISPLQALMKDQVNSLQNHYFCPAEALMDGNAEDPQIIQNVLNGIYTHVFGSPECLLASKVWRIILSSPSFREHLIGVAIDEAHCIAHW